MSDAGMVTREQLQGKRLLGLDFGLRRVGWAVCDELHLSVTPGGVLSYGSPRFWEELQELIESEHVQGIVVGIPAGSESPRTLSVVAELRHFVERLRQRFPYPVYLYDETGSTKRAYEAMSQMGVGQKRRRRRGESDRIAAALILWDFLQELHTWGKVYLETLE